LAIRFGVRRRHEELVHLAPGAEPAEPQRQQKRCSPLAGPIAGILFEMSRRTCTPSSDDARGCFARFC
jgi:hypothetical protein